MEFNLKDKVALVTGGSHGLGKAICLALAEEGAKIAINYRSDPQKARSLSEELEGRFGTETYMVYGDISMEAYVRSMFEEVHSHFSEIDILVNNSGICPVSLVRGMKLSEWEDVITTNLTGTFLTNREMVRYLISCNKKGNIVNIASQAAYNGSRSGKSHYAASKGGVVTFTLSLAKEVAEYGIRVNAVAPGMIYTDMTAGMIEKDMERYRKDIPLQRIADAEEVARAVVYLASDSSSYITGTTLDISGGMIGI